MHRNRDSQASKRRYVRLTRWRRRRFFALLAESGSVRLACELSGVGLGCIYRLRRTEPGFVAAMEAARARADAWLDGKAPKEVPPPRLTRSSDGSIASPARSRIAGGNPTRHSPCKCWGGF